VSREKKVGSTIIVGVHCTQQVACVISLLIFGCMIHACGYLVILFSLARDFPRLAVVLALPFNFLESHDVVGSLFD